MNADTMPTSRRQLAEEPPVKCELGRPLGDCSLRRSGCGSLLVVLTRLYPPPALLALLGRAPDLDPDIVRWLQSLEAVTPAGMTNCKREASK